MRAAASRTFCMAGKSSPSRNANSAINASNSNSWNAVMAAQVAGLGLGVALERLGVEQGVAQPVGDVREADIRVHVEDAVVVGQRMLRPGVEQVVGRGVVLDDGVHRVPRVQEDGDLGT